MSIFGASFGSRPAFGTSSQSQLQIQPFQQFQQPQQPQQPQQSQGTKPLLYLKTPDAQGRLQLATGSTRWEDLHPDSQNCMKQLEKIIQETKTQCASVESCQRLYHARSFNQKFDTTCQTIQQAMSSIKSKMIGQEAIIESLSTQLASLMELSKKTVYSYAVLRSRYPAAYLASLMGHSSSASVPPASVDPSGFYESIPSLPSPILVSTTAQVESTIHKYWNKIQEVQKLLSAAGTDAELKSSSHVLQSLPQILRHMHSYCAQLASQLGMVSQRVEAAKSTFLKSKRDRGDYSDPFAEADNREASKKHQALSRARTKYPSMMELLLKQGGPAGQQGQTLGAPSGGIFGQQGQTQGTSSAGLFGQSQGASSTGIFGQSQGALSTGLFGQGASSGGLFGSSTTPSLFGSSQPASTSLFGASSTPAGSTVSAGLFSSTPASTSQFGAARPAGGLFGSSTPSPFGQASSVAGTSTPANPFGASSAAQSSTVAFGSTPAPSGTTGFGLFGATTPAGASSTPAFGSSSFQTPAANIFGQAAAAGSGASAGGGRTRALESTDLNGNSRSNRAKR